MDLGIQHKTALVLASSKGLGKAVAMGYVRLEQAGIGSEIFIKVRDKALKAQVVKMPFA